MCVVVGYVHVGGTESSDAVNAHYTITLRPAGDGSGVTVTTKDETLQFVLTLLAGKHQQQPIQQVDTTTTHHTKTYQTHTNTRKQTRSRRSVIFVDTFVHKLCFIDVAIYVRCV